MIGKYVRAKATPSLDLKLKKYMSCSKTCLNKFSAQICIEKDFEKYIKSVRHFC